MENDGKHNDPCVRAVGYETPWVGNKGLGNRAVFMHERYAWNDLDTPTLMIFCCCMYL